MRRFQAFFLLVTLSVSSVAMPVFTHVCNGMGKSWTSLFVPPADCCEQAGTSTAACSAASEASQDCSLSKNPCCENEVSLATIGTDYTFDSSASPTKLLILGIQALSFIPVADTDVFTTDIQRFILSNCPTPRYGRSLLIFEQLFLC